MDAKSIIDSLIDQAIDKEYLAHEDEESIFAKEAKALREGAGLIAEGQHTIKRDAEYIQRILGDRYTKNGESSVIALQDTTGRCCSFTGTYDALMLQLAQTVAFVGLKISHEPFEKFMALFNEMMAESYQHLREENIETEEDIKKNCEACKDDE